MRIRQLIIVGLFCVLPLLLAVVGISHFRSAVRRNLLGAPLYYHKIDIDTRTMNAGLSDPFAEPGEPHVEYYSTFRSMADLGVYHYDGSIRLPFRVRYNAFSADFDMHLRGRSKLQELVTRPYGTVYAETKYCYTGPRWSRLEVFLWASHAEHEPAQVVDALPQPTPPLSAFSIIRVFHDRSRHTVATAVYSPRGVLRRTQLFGSKGGNGPPTDAEIETERNALRNEAAVRLKYGFADHLPIADYAERQHWEWSDVGKPNPENIINLHYDHNRWLRQDLFDAGGKRTTRYLTYVVTPEDKILESIDRESPFDEGPPR